VNEIVHWLFSFNKIRSNASGFWGTKKVRMREARTGFVRRNDPSHTGPGKEQLSHDQWRGEHRRCGKLLIPDSTKHRFRILGNEKSEDARSADWLCATQ